MSTICKNWETYQGIYKPKCNNGNGCSKCWEVWRRNQLIQNQQDLVEFLKENLVIDGYLDSGGGNYGYDRASANIFLSIHGQTIVQATIS